MKPSEFFTALAQSLRAPQIPPADRERFAAGLDDLVAHSTAESGAVLEIVAERRRQVCGEGYAPEGDDNYTLGQLALAAAAYAAWAAHQAEPDQALGVMAFKLWPWRSSAWKPRDPRGNLVRAGALIVAELERLDRAAARAAR